MMRVRVTPCQPCSLRPVARVDATRRRPSSRKRGFESHSEHHQLQSSRGSGCRPFKPESRWEPTVGFESLLEHHADLHVDTDTVASIHIAAGWRRASRRPHKPEIAGSNQPLQPPFPRSKDDAFHVPLRHHQKSPVDVDAAQAAAAVRGMVRRGDDMRRKWR